MIASKIAMTALIVFIVCLLITTEETIDSVAPFGVSAFLIMIVAFVVYIWQWK